MSKFKVGDRVIGNSEGMYGITKKGWVGTVTAVEGETIWVHGPEAVGDKGFCVWEKYFDLYTPDEAAQKIVVTTDGKTTTARLFDGKKCVKTAEAKLSKKDTFSFETGAAWALGRLLGRDLEKPAEPDPTKFDKSLLVDGRFVHLSKVDSYSNAKGLGWAIVVGDRLIYAAGGYDRLADLSLDGSFEHDWLKFREIDAVVSALSFGNAASVAAGSGEGGRVLWKRPGAKFD